MTVAVTVSFKPVSFKAFNTYLGYQPRSHPKRQYPASPNFPASLPVPLDVPYRLRQTNYTLPTFFLTDGWTDGQIVPKEDECYL